MIRRRTGYAIWLLAMIILYFFENNTGTRILLAASVLIPAVSVFCSVFASRRMRVSLTGPLRLRKGEEGSCSIEVTGSRLLAGCNVVIGVTITNPLVGTEQEKTVLGRNSRISFPVPSEYCGQVCIFVQQTQVMDWFGLWKSQAADAGKPKLGLLIDPAAEEQRENPARFSDPSRQESKETVYVYPGVEDGRIRTYIPGDPVRLIHWKLSAKTDQVLLRERIGSGAEGPVLLLETRLKSQDPERMDKAVESLLAVSGTLAGERILHTVCWYDYGRQEWKQMTADDLDREERLAEEVLKSSSSLHGTPVTELFRQYYPDVREEQIYVFDPNDPKTNTDR